MHARLLAKAILTTSKVLCLCLGYILWVLFYFVSCVCLFVCFCETENVLSVQSIMPYHDTILVGKSRNRRKLFVPML